MIMKNLIDIAYLIIVVSFCSKLTGVKGAESAAYSFNMRFEGGYDDYINSVVVDGNNNIIVCGYFKSSSLIIDHTSGQSTPIPNTDTTSSGTSASSVGFLSKFSSNGALSWSAYFDGANNEIANTAIADSGGNVYVGGSFISPSTVITGTNTQTITPVGGSDGLIIKFSPTGAISWVVKIDGSSNEVVNSMAIDNSNNLIAVGTFGTATSQISGPTGSPISLVKPDASTNAGFLVKISASGSPNWAVRMNSISTESITAVAVDHSDNIIVGGYFNHPLDFYDTTGTNAVKTLTNVDTATTAGFAVKYSSSGIFSWGVRMDGSSGDIVNSVAVDNNNNVIVGGSYRSTLQIYEPDAVTSAKSLTTAAPTVNAAFVVKFTSLGVFSWAARIDGSSADSVKSVTTDNSNNIIIGGQCAGSTFTVYDANDQSQTTLNNAGFMIKYSSTGTFLWIITVGTGTTLVNAVASDSNNNVLIGGIYKIASFRINNSTGTQVATLIGSTGYYTGFVVKYLTVTDTSSNNPIDISSSSMNPIVGTTILAAPAPSVGTTLAPSAEVTPASAAGTTLSHVAGTSLAPAVGTTPSLALAAGTNPTPLAGSAPASSPSLSSILFPGSNSISFNPSELTSAHFAIKTSQDDNVAIESTLRSSTVTTLSVEYVSNNTTQNNQNKSLLGNGIQANVSVNNTSSNFQESLPDTQRSDVSNSNLAGESSGGSNTVSVIIGASFSGAIVVGIIVASSVFYVLRRRRTRRVTQVSIEKKVLLKDVQFVRRESNTDDAESVFSRRESVAKHD